MSHIPLSPSFLFRQGSVPYHRHLVTWITCAIIGWGSTLYPVEPLWAASFRIYDQGASASSQANAFTAQADDPSAVYYNPAGMTQLSGVQFYGGMTLIGGHSHYSNLSGTAQTRGDFGGSVGYPPPSNAYLTANLKDLGVRMPILRDMSLGLGMNFPYGTKFRFPNDGPFASAVTTAALQMMDIKPTLAYKVSKHLSLGIGLDIYTFTSLVGEGRYESRLSAGPGLGLLNGQSVEINGKDTAFGFNVSLLYPPFLNEDGKPLCSFGLVYRSQSTLHLDGEARANGAYIADSSTTLVIPQSLTGGLAVWPIRDRQREWKVEFDVDYTGWNSVRNLDVRLSSGAAVTGVAAPLTVSNPQNYHGAFLLSVGTEYKWVNAPLLPQWDVALRGGYWFSESPTPDHSYNPAVPDANNHAISIGLGLLCKGSGRFMGLVECGNFSGSWYKPSAIGIDIGYKTLWYEPRTVRGNTNPFANPAVVDGTYRTMVHVGSINFRVNF